MAGEHIQLIHRLAAATNTAIFLSVIFFERFSCHIELRGLEPLHRRRCFSHIRIRRIAPPHASHLAAYGAARNLRTVTLRLIDHAKWGSGERQRSLGVLNLKCGVDDTIRTMVEMRNTQYVTEDEKDARLRVTEEGRRSEDVLVQTKEI